MISNKLVLTFLIYTTSSTRGSVKTSLCHLNGPDAKVLHWIITKDSLLALFSLFPGFAPTKVPQKYSEAWC